MKGGKDGKSSSDLPRLSKGSGQLPNEETPLFPVDLHSDDEIAERAQCLFPCMTIIITFTLVFGMALTVAVRILTPFAISCALAVLLASFSPATAGPFEPSGVKIRFDLTTMSTLSIIALGMSGGHSLLLAAAVGVPGQVPYHCLGMFFGALYLCLSLEQTGLLREIAASLVTRLAPSPGMLLFVVALAGGALTVVLPDDVVTMSCVPALCDAARRVGLSPYPFIFAMFFAANSWSIALVTGNPTNVLVAEAVQVADGSGGSRPINFTEFASFCAVPGMLGGACCALVSYFLFISDMQPPENEARDEDLSEVPMDSTPYTIFCCVRLAFALIICCVDWATGLPAWAVVFAMGACSIIADLVIDTSSGTHRAKDVLLTAPWELFLFLYALFVVVECLHRDGCFDFLASYLEDLGKSTRSVVFVVGIASAVTCQFVSTIPMSLVFIRTLTAIKTWSGPTRSAAMLAIVVGSNLGAIGTPIGSLGSQMFCHIVRGKGFPVTPVSFSAKGLPVMIMATLVACASLSVTVPLVSDQMGLKFVPPNNSTMSSTDPGSASGKSGSMSGPDGSFLSIHMFASI